MSTDPWLHDGITLKQYFDEKFSQIDYKITSIEKQTAIALTTLDKRLEGMNEFRDTLRDQASRFITRSELELVIARIEANSSRLESDIKNLQLARAQMEGKASQQSANIALAMGVIGIGLSVVSMILGWFH